MRQTAMFESRAKALDVSSKRLTGKALTVVAGCRKKLEPLAEPFDCIDNSIQVELNVLLEAVDVFARRLQESREWLDEPMTD